MEQKPPSQSTTRQRRRIYIIDREFQFKYLTTWLFLMLAFVFIIALSLAATNYYLKGGAAGVGTQLQLHLPELIKANAVFIALITVLIGLYCILLSHRVAGPAYRLSVSLKRICSGDYDFTVRLRKKDYLKNLAENVNELIQILRTRKEKLNLTLSEVKKLKESVTDCENLPPELPRILSDIEKTLQEETSVVNEKKAEP